MHLCMQDNQIDQKFMGLALAVMARLPHLKTQKIVFISKWPSPPAGTTLEGEYKYARRANKSA
jgi:hypothetical protein